MEKLDTLTNYILGICSAGLTFRIIYCQMRIMVNPEEAEGYKKRMNNALFFIAIAICVFALKASAISYFR